MRGSGDYIPREAAREAVWQILNGMGYSEKHNDRLVEEVDAILDDIPAADMRPVVRGKWINDRNGKYSASGDNFYCSICKDPSLRAFGKPAKTNYCPNCGADMRIPSTNCKNTGTTGEDREIGNLRAWLKNGQENKTK